MRDGRRQLGDGGEDWDKGKASRQQQDRAGPAAARVRSSDRVTQSEVQLLAPEHAVLWHWDRERPADILVRSQVRTSS